MKILIIGGTGTISTEVSKKLLRDGHELVLLNRTGESAILPQGAQYIQCDIHDEAAAAAALQGMTFDAVCDFIAFETSQLERDYRLFQGKTRQFVYISSASIYHKPLADYRVTEGTTLANPFWEYSRKKIEGEDYLMKLYREEGFPVTIVRPSHTYCERSVPLGVHGKHGSWQVLKRMLEGKPVLIHGDGTSLWTMTDSRDFAVGFTGLLGNPHAIGEAFQITSDETLTWNQIYGTIARCLGVELRPYYVASQFLADVSDRDYDLQGSLLGDKANAVVFDNSKLKRIVPEFHPTIRFEQGMQRTISYVTSHRECQQDDPEFDRWCDNVIEALEAAKASLRRS